MVRVRTILAAAVPAILLLGVAPAVATAGASTASTATPTSLTNQHLTWSICYPGAGLDNLKCAAVKVPLDWAKPAGKTIKIEISRIKASNPGKRRGILLTNPGGPGYPGLSSTTWIPQLEPTVAATYDLIGFDVRGVGESQPTFSCANPSILTKLLNLDGRDTSKSNQAEFRQLSQQYGQTCSKAPMTAYMNYEQIVRDLDLVRGLLGEPKISYLGFSAGSWLGAWYAAVFPQRVDRFVLDGNIDYTSPSYQSFDREPKGIQNAFVAFLQPWIAKYNSTYRLGTSITAVNNAYERDRAALVAHPLKLVNGAMLTAAAYDQGVASGLGATFVYPYIASAMSTIHHYSTATADEKKFVAEVFGGSLAAGQDPPWAITCTNDKRQTWAQVEQVTKSFRIKYPLFGSAWNTNPCPFFTTPVVGSPIKAKALPPLLMLANSDDPLTPLANALIDRSLTPNARLLTVLNDADHTIYGYGDACADGYANRWLVDGTLPAQDATCPGIPLPKPLGQSTAESVRAQTHRPPMMTGSHF